MKQSMSIVAHVAESLLTRWSNVTGGSLGGGTPCRKRLGISTSKSNNYLTFSIFSRTFLLLWLFTILTDFSVQYHTAVVNLFTPVAYSDVLFEKDAEAIRKAILFHARSGLEILRQAARLYSSRYNLPLIAFCALHLGDAMIRNNSPSDPSSAQAAEFVLDVLRENGKGFAICGPLQQLFRRSVAHYGVRLDEAVDERLGFGIRYSVDDILDACTRVTYTQPTDQIVRYLDRSTAENWHDEWLRLMEETRGEPEQEISSERYLQINSLLNV